MACSTRSLTALLILLALGQMPLDAGNIYWTDKGDFSIRRGEMDGSGVPEVLLGPADGLGIPQNKKIKRKGSELFYLIV